MNSLVFGLIAVVSLFAFFKLAKVKASSKQLNRNDRINRFKNHNQNTENIIEGESEEINDEEDK